MENGASSAVLSRLLRPRRLLASARWQPGAKARPPGRRPDVKPYHISSPRSCRHLETEDWHITLPIAQASSSKRGWAWEDATAVTLGEGFGRFVSTQPSLRSRTTKTYQ